MLAPTTTAHPRPYPTCLCAPEKPCVACPLAHACSCGSDVAQRCRRPSGHTGPFVMTHEDRLLRSDADAIARDPNEVEARLRAQRDNPAYMRLWARALRGLASTSQRSGRTASTPRSSTASSRWPAAPATTPSSCAWRSRERAAPEPARTQLDHPCAARGDARQRA